MNKRGFLLGEFTLKIVLSVLCLALLIYLLSSLYKVYSLNSDKEKASALLNELYEKIPTVTQTEEYKAVLIEPKSWNLVYFEKDGPAICAKLCLCICGKSGVYFINRKTDCEKAGVCKEFNSKLIVEKPVEIKGTANPIGIIVKKQGESYTITEVKK